MHDDQHVELGGAIRSYFETRRTYSEARRWVDEIGWVYEDIELRIGEGFTDLGPQQIGRLVERGRRMRADPQNAWDLGIHEDKEDAARRKVEFSQLQAENRTARLDAESKQRQAYLERRQAGLDLLKRRQAEIARLEAESKQRQAKEKQRQADQKTAAAQKQRKDEAQRQADLKAAAQWEAESKQRQADFELETAQREAEWMQERMQRATREEAEREQEETSWKGREFTSGHYTVRLTSPASGWGISVVAEALVPLLHATPSLRRLAQAEVAALIERAFHISPQPIAENVSQNDAVDLKKAIAKRGGRVRITEGRTRDGVTGREPIPASVRQEVWRRDGGRCVDCGSQERLEFDHIIPVSKGGSNTARNIELRCEICNRKKAATI